MVLPPPHHGDDYDHCSADAKHYDNPEDLFGQGGEVIGEEINAHLGGARKDASVTIPTIIGDRPRAVNDTERSRRDSDVEDPNTPQETC